MKETKRKGFNFYRSYFDVYNELSDKDKLAFIDALLKRQFLGVKPENLKGMAKFAYISQTNSIDQQVKGFETKTGLKLNDLREENTPTEGAWQGGADTPTLQEKGKGKEKEKEKVELLYSLYPTTTERGNGRVSTGKSDSDKNKIKTLLKKHSKEHIEKVINQYLDGCKKTGTYIKNFGTFLNNLPELIEDKREFDDRYNYFVIEDKPNNELHRLEKNKGLPNNARIKNITTISESWIIQW